MALVVKNPPTNAGDVRDLGPIPGSGRCPIGGHGNPLQYSCLEKTMDREAWRATVHGVAKSQTRLSDFTCSSSFSSWYKYFMNHITNTEDLIRLDRKPHFPTKPEITRKDIRNLHLHPESLMRNTTSRVFGP